jgi:hypothetical protein
MPCFESKVCLHLQPQPTNGAHWRTDLRQIAADFAAPREAGGPGAEILQPLPEARKDGLSLKTEPLMGAAEAPSITDRAECARRHLKISSDPGERASA